MDEEAMAIEEADDEDIDQLGVGVTRMEDEPLGDEVHWRVVSMKLSSRNE